LNPELAGRLHDADPGELGRRIRDLRLSRGLTQTELAAGAVTVGYISRIESGQRRPDTKLLEMFASVLETTAEYLVTGIEPRQSEELLLALLHAELALETGDADETLDVLGPLLRDESVQAPADVRERAEFLRARALESLGRFDEAISALDGLAERDQGGIGLEVVIALSRCLRDSGDVARAADVGEAALRSLQEAGIDGGDEAIRLAVTVAAAYFERGDTGQAVRIAMEAIRRADEMGSPTARAAAYWEASVLESRRGHTARAIPLAQRALALLAQGEDRRNFARLHAQIGLMLLRLDPPQVDDATDHLLTAREELSASSASVVDLARCDLCLARARLCSGDADGAAELATETMRATREIAPGLAAEAASVLGQVEVRRGSPSRAGELYRDAIGLLTGVGEDRNAAQLWLELGAQLDALGDVETARDAYRRAAVASGLQLPAALQLSQ
jgi:transcriptional regulator with XRE-family HTH domain